ncbi:cysteine--tRNA ligase [Ectothiorhodospiraceae bacterium BW-2]|nr:cysteine--tRNA ligase [Ectothiorhodospiraceae bacterium BW-2]
MPFNHQLRIVNSLSRQKELFVPLDPTQVRLYVCGMTVYDLCHIGHARVLVVFDTIFRYLQLIYGRDAVRYVRNVTDIDDKIIQRAKENSEPFEQLTQRYIEAMHQDSLRLSVLPPTEEPLATAHIAPIIEMVAQLIEKGLAYCVEGGDVYYDVSRFAAYGALSGKSLDDLRAGERVAVDGAKEDPLDFVLWKRAKAGEPSWDSPWGAGRPGWHIECSAMSTHALGDHFDIHGGGLDLQFPHHENEIAQSCGSRDTPFVNYWIHNGFVRVDDEKMSKSLGNFFTIREVLQRYQAEVVRYFILTSHYRSPLNYSDSHLDNAQAALTTLYNALRGVTLAAVTPQQCHTAAAERFMTVMDDDFNTPEALAILFELAHRVNRLKATDPEAAVAVASELKALAGLLGLLQQHPDHFLQGGGDQEGEAESIERLIEQRQQARQARQWGEADRIRDELKAMGVVLEDSAAGTLWRRESN